MNDLHQIPRSTLILAILVAGLTLSQIYLFAKLRTSPTATAPLPSAPAATVVQNDGASLPRNMLGVITGHVTTATASSLVLSTGDATSENIRIESSTKLVREGALKDAAAYAQEMEAFRLHVLEIQKDPEKNRAELETLRAPSPRIEIPLGPSDIAAGSVVNVLGYQTEDGVFHALQVTLVEQAAPQQ